MRVLFFILTFVLFNACSSIRVETDYSPQFAFDKPFTFSIVHDADDGIDSLTDRRIMDALEKEFTAKGYQRVGRDAADLYLLFHTDVHDKTRIDTDYQLLGMYPYGYGHQGMMIQTSRVSSYEEAKLIVDIVDPATNTIIWQGIATDRTRSYETPQERSAYINEVIGKLLERFPPEMSHR